MNAPLAYKNRTDPEVWPDLLLPPTDQIDQIALLDASKRVRLGDPVNVLDLDCGDGVLALRFAHTGANVLAIDMNHDGQALTSMAQRLNLQANFKFIQMSSPPFGDSLPLPGAPFDIVSCHYALPFLPYQSALVLVRRLLEMTKIGGRLYFSAFGLHSDLGEGYPDAERLVRDRFAMLQSEMAAKYEIYRSVCLYSERDLFMLLFNAGASVLRTFTTTHGNVKAVAGRT